MGVPGGGVRGEGAGRGFGRWAPKTAGLVGTIVVGLGFWGVFLAETMAEDRDEDGGWGTTLFVMGALGIGVNEIVGALQAFVKDQNDRNVKDLGWHLSQQWLVVRLGEVYSCVSCGAIYYYMGAKGVEAQGCEFLAMQLLFLLLYFLLDNCREMREDDLRWSILSSSSLPNHKSCKDFARPCPKHHAVTHHTITNTHRK